MDDPPPLPAADSVTCEACSHGRIDYWGIHVHKLSSHKMRAPRAANPGIHIYEATTECLVSPRFVALIWKHFEIFKLFVLSQCIATNRRGGDKWTHSTGVCNTTFILFGLLSTLVSWYKLGNFGGCCCFSWLGGPDLGHKTCSSGWYFWSGPSYPSNPHTPL